jgi:hypothetical protein
MGPDGCDDTEIKADDAVNGKNRDLVGNKRSV